MPVIDDESPIDQVRRVSFDKDAAAYDDARPSYPEAAIDYIMERSNAVDAVEIGAGTGKATVQFARCGLSIRAIEPGAHMAAILESKVVGLPVTVEVTTFEAFQGENYDLVYAAQAMHWIDPAVRYVKAHSVLRERGSLALLMNEQATMEPGLRAELNAAYARHFGWPPWDVEHVDKVVASWSKQITQSGLFHDISVTQFPWTATYTSDQYIALLGTYSDQAVRPDAERVPCFAEIRAAIDKRGGQIEVPYVTLAWFAVRSD